MTENQENSRVKFQYNEIVPPAPVAHLVLCFFEFSVKSDSSEPIRHVVFPDGCVSLLYRHNERLEQSLLLLKGLSLEPFNTEVQADDVHWGLKILPSAAEKILRCDPLKIPTKPVLNDGFLLHLTDGLLAKINKCGSFEAFAKELAEVLKGLEIDESEIDSKITQAVRYIFEHNGEKKISEIADFVGLSPRQLERRFRKAAGVTPKQFSRVTRLRATALNMLEGKMNWANRAAEMGFSDQAHLIREFFLLTKLSPKSFEMTVRQVKHDELIKPIIS